MSNKILQIQRIIDVINQMKFPSEQIFCDCIIITMVLLCKGPVTGELEMHYMHYNYSIRQKQGHRFVFNIAFFLERELDEWDCGRLLSNWILKGNCMFHSTTVQ